MKYSPFKKIKCRYLFSKLPLLPALSELSRVNRSNSSVYRIEHSQACPSGIFNFYHQHDTVPSFDFTCHGLRNNVPIFEFPWYSDTVSHSSTLVCS